MNRTNGFSVTAYSSAMPLRYSSTAYTVNELLSLAGETTAGKEGGML
jgi:hypothetical protein